MSATLEIRAEILKLARLLGRDPDELEYMERVPAEDIRQLREQVTEVLFAANRGALGRLASASRLLPVGLVATIGERAFGPVLSARVAAILDPDRAVEMAAKLPDGFLAEVAIYIDPRRADQVIAGIPPRRIAAITRELLRRDEYVTMGRFVGHLRDEAISAAVDAMDDSSLLQVAFVLESKETLRELIGMLPKERLDGIIDAAADEGLWPEALDLLVHLSDQQRTVFADRAAARDEAVLQSLVHAAQELGLWAAVLPMTSSMSENSKRRFATLPAIQADGVLEEIVRVAAQCELWGELLPLVGYLRPKGRDRVAAVLATIKLDGRARELVAAQGL